MSVSADVHLLDVCEIVMGQAPSGAAYNDDGEGYPLIAGAGDFGESHPAPKKFTREAAKLSHREDIILGIRATIGEKVWSDGTYALGRGVAALRPSPRLDRHYLWHWLTHIAPELSHRSKGATFKQVTRVDIGTLVLSLPPLAEQRRIAAILDKADDLRAKRRAALATLDGLAQSAFVEMFGDPVTNPRGWKRRRLAEIGRVTTGNTPSREHAEYYGDGIEWIKSDNINTSSPVLTPAVERLSELGRQVGRTARTGSILVTCIAGSPSCIGNVAIADREVAFNQQINALTPNDDLNVFFLYCQFVLAKALVQLASTGGMKGLVSKSRFESVEFITPPSSLQMKFGELFDGILGHQRQQAASLGRLDALFSSLQHRAFAGEL